MQSESLGPSVQTLPTPAERSLARGVSQSVRHWLTGRRGLIIAGIALAGAGLAFGWSWLTAIGIAPLILSLAPCAAMCALGWCMMGKGTQSHSKQDSQPETK